MRPAGNMARHDPISTIPTDIIVESIHDAKELVISSPSRAPHGLPGPWLVDPTARAVPRIS
jgi:hypothetical protein